VHERRRFRPRPQPSASYPLVRLARQKSTHVDDPVAVGQRLRAARTRAGLSLRQLAFPGCSVAYLSHIEAGRRTPSLQVLVELARRLRVSTRYLTFGEGDGGDEVILTGPRRPLHVDDPVAVGARLRAARTRAGLSLRQLAFPGCSAAYLSHIERGRRTPSLQVLVELAERLRLSTYYLAFGVGGVHETILAEGRCASSNFALETYRRALHQARTRDERVWALAGLGQVAAARGDDQMVTCALKRALELLTDEH
jgi:transcriptional regulator with XRE-family HTH domain